MQVIPELAKEVSELTVYQRTPIWVMPKIDFGFSPAVQRLFARVPLAQRILRWFTDTGMEFMMVVAMWKFRYFKRLNIAASDLAKLHRFLSVRDKELRRKLTPDYDFGCKRPTLSNSYYRTFTKPHVHLETSGIERIEPDGIVTRDGAKRFIDTLVLATGFDVWDANLPAIEVIGRDGRNLGKWWRENRFQAYEGVSVPYFPNFLTVASPYAWLGLSWFNTVEYQMRHMDRLFGELQRRGGSHLRGHRTGQCPLPRSDDRTAWRFGVLPRQLRDLTVVLVQPQRGSAAFPADVGAKRREGTGPFPVGGLRDSVTPAREAVPSQGGRGRVPNRPGRTTGSRSAGRP